MLINVEIVRWFWLVVIAGLLITGGAFAVCMAIASKFWDYRRRQVMQRLLLACVLTILLWPVCLIRHPISESYAGMSQNAYSQFHADKPWPSWNYYGVPFPIHRSHDYLGHLTISIQRYPIVEGVFLNVVFWFILFHYIKRPKREQSPAGDVLKAAPEE